MKTLYLFAFSFLILSACQTIRVEKRLHGKGYAVFWNKKIRKAENTIDPTQVAQTITTEEKTITENTDVSSENLDTFPEQLKINNVNNNPKTSYTFSTVSSSTSVSTGSSSTISENPTHDEQHKENMSVINQPPGTNGDSNLIFLALGFPFLAAIVLRKRNRKLAVWASENKTKAQLSIAGLSVMSASASYFLGGFYSSYTIPELLPLSSALLGGCGMLYLSKNKQTKHLATIGLSASSSLLLFALGTMDEPIYVEDARILPLWLSITLTVLIVAMVFYAVAVIAALSCMIWCSTAQLLPALLVAGAGGYIVCTLGFWGIFSLYKSESQRNISFFPKALWWGLLGVLAIGWVVFVANYYAYS